jgi:hypothetical protein
MIITSKRAKAYLTPQPVPGFGWKPRDAKRFVLSSQKSNNNAAFQVDFLKSGWGALFWKSPSKRGLVRDALPRRVCTLQAVVAIPMASKDRAGFQFP